MTILSKIFRDAVPSEFKILWDVKLVKQGHNNLQKELRRYKNPDMWASVSDVIHRDAPRMFEILDLQSHTYVRLLEKLVSSGGAKAVSGRDRHSAMCQHHNRFLSLHLELEDTYNAFKTVVRHLERSGVLREDGDVHTLLAFPFIQAQISRPAAYWRSPC